MLKAIKREGFLKNKINDKKIGNNFKADAKAIKKIAKNLLFLTNKNSEKQRRSKSTRFTCPIPKVNLKGKEKTDAIKIIDTTKRETGPTL